eukprot:7808013-Pyramimonas_sp.AAC.1
MGTALSSSRPQSRASPVPHISRTSIAGVVDALLSSPTRSVPSSPTRSPRRGLSSPDRQRPASPDKRM